MEGGVLYSEIARCYDLIYHEKDYRAEVEKLVPLIEENRRSKERRWGLRLPA